MSDPWIGASQSTDSNKWFVDPPATAASGSLAATTPATQAAIEGQAATPGSLAAVAPGAVAAFAGAYSPVGHLVAATPGATAAVAGDYDPSTLGRLSAHSSATTAQLAGSYVGPSYAGALAARVPRTFVHFETPRPRSTQLGTSQRLHFYRRRRVPFLG